MMIEQLGAKNLKGSGRTMIEKVMIQLGQKKKTAGGGGASVPPRQGLMVQVRIQVRAN